MIFISFLRSKFFVNKLTWLYTFEFHTIDWIHEYEIEKYKLYNVIKRILVWFKSYKFFSPHITGIVEWVEYIKSSAIANTIWRFVFHTVQYTYAEILLIYKNCYYVFIKSPYFKILSFLELKIMESNSTSVWQWVHDFYVHNRPFVKTFFVDTLNVIHTDMTSTMQHKLYKLPVLIRTLRLINTEQTTKNFFKFFFFGLQKKFNLISRFLLGSYYIAFIVVFFLFIFFIFKEFYYFNIFKNVWLLVVVVFLLYFFISTYFNFSKLYHVGKYTSQTQRFWKRTFGIFWGLEFTLFIIYLYLTLISPAELASYGTNYKEIITGLNVVKNTNYHVIYFIFLLLLNFMYFCLLFLKKRNNFHFFKIVLILINFLYLYVLYYEFYKFYYVAGWGTHTTQNTLKTASLFEYNSVATSVLNDEQQNSLYFKVPTSINTSWSDISSEKQWLRTFRHFIYILILLKFWHAFFIYFYYALSLQKFIETNYWSFDTLSSNQQNTLYLFWFYLFSYTLIIKKKIYFLITFIYYWSSVQLNYTDFFYNFFCEFNIFFIFYV